MKRIILSRELSLKEIEKIRQKCLDKALEVFVDGALTDTNDAAIA